MNRESFGHETRPPKTRAPARGAAAFLVIVESPAKAKTLEKFLGKDYRVLASYGHVRDLPKKGLGVDRANDYEPTYEVLPGKEKTLGGAEEGGARARTPSTSPPTRTARARPSPGTCARP